MRTTPEIHRQLEATEPVPEVVQLPVTGHNRIYVQKAGRVYGARQCGTAGYSNIWHPIGHATVFRKPR